MFKMYFLTLVIKNLFRSKARTLLTTLGISLGIATIVAFGSITKGLTQSMTTMFRPGQTDFTVIRAGSADVVLSFLDNEQLEFVKNLEGVDRVAPYVMTFTQSEANPFFLLGGLEADSLDLLGIDLYEGRIFENDAEVIFGKIAAKNRNLGVLDTVTIHDQEYKIVGLFESGLAFQDGGAITTLVESQRVQGLNKQVNVINVSVLAAYNPSDVAKNLEELRSDLIAVSDSSDYAAADAGLSLTNQITWVISLLAVLIGSIGVMNTIIMSVFERTREIGILRAIGWSKARIILMILLESLLIGVAAAFLGTFIGIGFILALQQTEMGSSWLVVSYELETFYAAFGVALGVALFGAFYPALKAARLNPIEAIRYE